MTAQSSRLPYLSPRSRAMSESELRSMDENESSTTSMLGSDRPVFTSVATHGDDRALQAHVLHYQQLAHSRPASMARLAAYFDSKPRGPFTDQRQQYSRTWQIARSLHNSNRHLVNINNPAWNVAQGGWNDPQPVTHYGEIGGAGDWVGANDSEENGGRRVSQAMRVHARRASLDKRTFRSQPFVYHVLQPKDRFDFGIDGRLWRVEQERQRLERMEAHDRPSEFFFHGHVHYEPPVKSMTETKQ